MITKSVFKQRIAAFVQLGNVLKNLSTDQHWPGFTCGLTKEEYEGMTSLIETLYLQNGWFTPQNVKNALFAWSNLLSEENLQEFTKPYIKEEVSTKKIAIICAGNIPMVGFHDIFCVLLSGHHAFIKLSSDDKELIPAMLIMLEKFEPEMKESYSYASGKMEDFQAVIATGSNNTSRYFNEYFKNYPHIIRKNRTSVAIITGEESEQELIDLGKDIFLYFGLGCRSITKLFLPEGYDIQRVFAAIYPYHPIINHNKYANNYDYHKALWLLNQDDLLDNGFILFKQDAGLHAPTASLYYEYYENIGTLKEYLQSMNEEIQCIVGADYLPLGTAQSPQLEDYADGINTMEFLARL